MSTLGTFARYAQEANFSNSMFITKPFVAKRYRFVRGSVNPVERIFQNKRSLLNRNATDIIDEGVKKLSAGNRRAVLRRDPAIQIVPVKNAQTSAQNKGGALTWELPDARNARARVGRPNMALPAGEDKKKGANLGLILGLAGGGAALAGGGATAIALANRKKKKGQEQSESSMSSPYGLSSFASEDPFIVATRGKKKAAMQGVRDKEKEFWNEAYKNADADKQEAMRKQSGKYLRQRNIENIVDSEGGVGKAYSKGGLKDVGNVTTALLGNPERNLVAAGKKSNNKFLKDLAEGVENVGRAGYRAGATGGQKLINKAVGRTFTGKVARLTGVGLGLSAIGSAMKRNRQEQE